MKLPFLKRKDSPISLFLHLGMPKTGSTAIQDYLAFNRNILKQKHKTLYPECGIPINQHTSLVKSIVLPMYDWAHFNSAIETFDPESYIDNVIRQCRENNCSKVVMSSEFLWASPAMQAGPEYHTDSETNFEYIRAVVKRCRDLLAAFDKIKIVIYLRDQEDWLDSFYNQQLKDGFDIPDSEEILQEKKNFLMYHRNIDIWSEYFGKNNIVVRSFAQIHKDIISDFLLTTGLKRNAMEEPASQDKSANTRLSACSAEIMRKAIRLGFDKDTLALLKQVLQETSQKHYLSGNRFDHTLFDDGFYHKIRKLYHEDNKKLAEKYCHISPVVSTCQNSDNTGNPSATEKLLNRLLSSK